jgi:pimeloyl-ACP methyl ester carboxylesterase
MGITSRRPRPARAHVGWFAAVLLLAVVGSAACSGGEESPSAPVQDVTATCLDDEEIRTGVVEFSSADGEQLEGYQLGEGDTGVVLAHQSDGDLCQWKAYATTLSQQGYRALTFTFKNTLDADVVGAVDQLRRAGAKQVFLLGASMGGTASLAGAAKAEPPVNGVISLSAPMAYRGANALTAAPKLTMPLLFVAGDQDAYYGDQAKQLHDAATKAPERKLMIVKSSAHGVDLVSGEVQSAIETFLRDHSAT